MWVSDLCVVCSVHVLCCYSLLASDVDGVKGQVMTMLRPIMSTLEDGKVKGQEALLNELKKLNT